jgi:hypothetical protein
MKSLLLFLVTINCFVSFGQSVNLGTTYFRNDQYLISFDKVLYPGYILQIENVRKRDYLMGKMISDSLFELVLPTDKVIDGNTFTYAFTLESNYFGIDGNYHNECIPIENEECFGTSGIILISGNEITSESYDNISSNFQVLLSSSGTIKRLNKETKNVDIVLIVSNFDVETNQIVQNEISQGSRGMLKNEVADVEGNVYLTTTIGDQTWIAENLRSTLFNDGTQIPVMSESQWANSTAPGIVNKSAEGVFYNFYTLISDKNVCPQGFHVPHDEDVSELYNNITPYGDYLKISRGTVKRKSYSPLLAPVVIPVVSSLNLAWWSLQLGFVTGVASAVAASDLVLFSSELALSPIFGWRTKKAQYAYNLRQAKKYSYIEENGIPVEVVSPETTENQITSLKPINADDWNNFLMVRVFDETYFEEMDYESIDSLKKNHVNYSYKFKFKPFNLPGTDKFWSTTAFLFDEIDFSDGLGLTSLNPLPYKSVYTYEYPSAKYTSSIGRFQFQPVLTLLLNNSNNEFANQFGFNLNLDNSIAFPKNLKTKMGAVTGISYIVDQNLPGYFGIQDKMKGHELNLLENISLTKADLLKMQTRVRCVKD